MPIIRLTMPCCRCMKCSAATSKMQPKSTTSSMRTKSIDGIDELGVLLFGHDNNAYWYGSQLSIEETRKLAPYQNATGLQVTSAVLGGMVWALENPEAGIVEADEMDFDRLPGNPDAVSRPGEGLLHRLDPAVGPARPVPGRHRHLGSLAVPERAGAVEKPTAVQAVLCTPSTGATPERRTTHRGLHVRRNNRLSQSRDPDAVNFCEAEGRRRCFSSDGSRWSDQHARHHCHCPVGRCTGFVHA